MSVKTSPLYFWSNLNFEASLFEVIKSFSQYSSQQWKILSGPVSVSLMSPMPTTNFSNTISNISSSSPHHALLYLHYNSLNASRLILALFKFWVVEIFDSFFVFTPVSLERWPGLMRFMTPHPLSQAPTPAPWRVNIGVIKPMTSFRPSEYMACLSAEFPILESLKLHMFRFLYKP